MCNILAIFVYYIWCICVRLLTICLPVIAQWNRTCGVCVKISIHFILEFKSFHSNPFCSHHLTLHHTLPGHSLHLISAHTYTHYWIISLIGDWKCAVIFHSFACSRPIALQFHFHPALTCLLFAFVFDAVFLLLCFALFWFVVFCICFVASTPLLFCFDAIPAFHLLIFKHTYHSIYVHMHVELKIFLILALYYSILFYLL